MKKVIFLVEATHPAEITKKEKSRIDRLSTVVS
jgi:hypothetical protein